MVTCYWTESAISQKWKATHSIALSVMQGYCMFCFIAFFIFSINSILSFLKSILSFCYFSIYSWKAIACILVLCKTNNECFIHAMERIFSFSERWIVPFNLAIVSLNRTFHLSPHKNILTIARIRTFIICILSHSTISHIISLQEKTCQKFLSNYYQNVFYSCKLGKNIFIRWMMDCSIQLAMLLYRLVE